MQTNSGKQTWTNLKRELAQHSPAALLALLQDLYRASAETRRFLHARFLDRTAEIADCRHRLAAAIYPDPWGRQPVRIAEAKRIIRQYEQATGDVPGTVDLMLTFVETGTAQAIDVGYGDDRYFAALETMLGRVPSLLPEMPLIDRQQAVRRVRQLAARASELGWGYGDYVREVAANIGDESNTA